MGLLVFQAYLLKLLLIFLLSCCLCVLTRKAEPIKKGMKNYLYLSIVSRLSPCAFVLTDGYWIPVRRGEVRRGERCVLPETLSLSGTSFQQSGRSVAAEGG